MRRDRLLKLADFLEKNVSQESFDLNRWTNTCGTICCAFGWATHIPEFQADGLSMDGRVEYGYPTGSYSEFNQPKYCKEFPNYKEFYGYDAAAAFFEITPREALWVFDNTSYDKNDLKQVPIETVIARIRYFAKPDWVYRIRKFVSWLLRVS